MQNQTMPVLVAQLVVGKAQTFTNPEIGLLSANSPSSHALARVPSANVGDSCLAMARVMVIVRRVRARHSCVFDGVAISSVDWERAPPMDARSIEIRRVAACAARSLVAGLCAQARSGLVAALFAQEVARAGGALSPAPGDSCSPAMKHNQPVALPFCHSSRRL